MNIQASPSPRITYIVKTASACMPRSCWGRYGRVAVLRVDTAVCADPSRIDARIRGVEIVALYDRLHRGSTTASAYYRALAAATEQAAALNEAQK